MCKPFVLLAVALLATTGQARSAELTDTEMRWLRAGWPVVNYAKEQELPLDISVLPQAKPGDAPLAMGFENKRCKLVLAMRGNPEAESTLAQIPPGLEGPVVQAMVAHELGHCWRYVHGAWHTVPAGFVDTIDETSPIADREIARLRHEMRETRREEGFADLVGLAWTQQRHPQHYAQVHAWFAQVRDDQPVPGAHHDTRSWLKLTRDPSAFGPPDGTDPFRQAWPLWQQGLRAEH
jgi:ADP-ribose pyrophosphatase YjhB (NUDIX family)